MPTLTNSLPKYCKQTVPKRVYGDQTSDREIETLEMFRAIASSIAMKDGSLS